MIEPIMYVAIGFLVACMLVIGIIPVVHARAVRLTTRRLEAMTPMSMAEIQADKDQLRAEFAMSTRRLEMSVDQMKAKTTSQLAELGKRSEALGRVKLELSEKTAALFALEAKEKQLSEDLHETRQHRDEKTVRLEETERLLGEAHAHLAVLTSTANDSSMTVDNQRVELVTARAQIEVLKGQVESYDKESRDLHERLAIEAAAADATRHALQDEIAKNEVLANRVTELERQVVAQTTEAEVLGRRVQELLASVDEQNRREALESERVALEGRLKQAQAERDRLQGEIMTVKRDAEAARAAERTENTVLRERLNDVAAEVARLTAVLEGPNSPIDSMLATEPGRTNAVPLAPAVAAGEKPGGEGRRDSLADRIRALQDRAAQVPQARRA
jgi:chromosome segregation ATPase